MKQLLTQVSNTNVFKKGWSAYELHLLSSGLTAMWATIRTTSQIFIQNNLLSMVKSIKTKGGELVVVCKDLNISSM